MEATRFNALTRNLAERNERTMSRRSLVALLAGSLLAAGVASVPDAEAWRRGGWGGGRRRPGRPCYRPRRHCHGPARPPRESGVSAPPIVLPPICIATGESCPATCSQGECSACCGGVCNANATCGTPA